MRIKKWKLITLVLLLVLPTFFINVSANEQTFHAKENSPKNAGEILAKDEVVYAKLTENGELNNIYVVNIFEMEKHGQIVDHGSYSTIKNLTDLSNMEQKGDEIHFTANKDKFYYQGNMENGKLPWHFSVSYYLNGREQSPTQLAGKSGAFQIKIETSRNEQGDPTFYENYLLQISLSLDTDKFENIEANDAAIANAGKNKQITFTVMPENDGNFEISGDVTDFEIDGIDIAAVPSTMSIDAPNVDEMTGEMETLADAISQLHDGVSQLKSGVTELNDGVDGLVDGSKAYKDGMNEIDGASAELIQASEKINAALKMINSQLSNHSIDEIDMTDYIQLIGALSKTSEGLLLLATNIEPLIVNYPILLNTLSEKIDDIPDYFSNEQLEQLTIKYYENQEVQALIDAYIKGQIVKQTFHSAQMQDGLQSISLLLEELVNTLSEMGNGLKIIIEELNKSIANTDTIDINSSLEQLTYVLSELADNYGQFHNGLVAYTDGISTLTSSYEQLHSGLTQLFTGTNELKDGVGELHDGTKELNDATKQIPDGIENKIDEMVKEYDKSDFNPKSFVSDKNNDKIQSVQFVIRTESIKKEETEIKEEKKEEKKGFWTLLLDLFK